MAATAEDRCPQCDGPRNERWCMGHKMPLNQERNNELKAARLSRGAQTPTITEKLAKQLVCRHEHTRGGNDYVSCDDCELEWDYTKLTPLLMLQAANHSLASPSQGTKGAK